MPLEPLTKPIDLEPNVQDLMNNFKAVIENAHIDAMCLYLRLNKETGDQQWAVNVLDRLEEIKNLLRDIYKAKACAWKRGSDGGIIISN